MKNIRRFYLLVIVLLIILPSCLSAQQSRVTEVKDKYVIQIIQLLKSEQIEGYLALYPSYKSTVYKEVSSAKNRLKDTKFDETFFDEYLKKDLANTKRENAYLFYEIKEYLQNKDIFHSKIACTKADTIKVMQAFGAYDKSEYEAQGKYRFYVQLKAKTNFYMVYLVVEMTKDSTLGSVTFYPPYIVGNSFKCSSYNSCASKIDSLDNLETVETDITIYDKAVDDNTGGSNGQSFKVRLPKETEKLEDRFLSDSYHLSVNDTTNFYFFPSKDSGYKVISTTNIKTPLKCDVARRETAISLYDSNEDVFCILNYNRSNNQYSGYMSRKDKWNLDKVLFTKAD